VLGAPDARDLAAFYRRLLGWGVVQDEPGWVKLGAPEGGPGLSFQTETGYVRPAWPAMTPAPRARPSAQRLHGGDGQPGQVVEHEPGAGERVRVGRVARVRHGHDHRTGGVG